MRHAVAAHFSFPVTPIYAVVTRGFDPGVICRGRPDRCGTGRLIPFRVPGRGPNVVPRKGLAANGSEMSMKAERRVMSASNTFHGVALVAVAGFA